MYRNKINGKCYVGQTRNVKSRRRNHEKAYKKYAFQYALIKYGVDNFDFLILHENIESQSELDRLECEYILLYNCMSPNGYNIKNGGSHGKLSKETREKISKSNMGKKISIENRQHLSRLYSGRKFSYETRLKMSKSRTGMKRKSPSYNTRMLLSSYNKGKVLSEDTKKKISDSTTGVKKSHQHACNIGRAKSKMVICMNTGTIYDSATLAARIMDSTQGAISLACRNQSRTVHGMNYSYFIDNKVMINIDEIEARDKRQKRIICLNTGVIYDGISMSARSLGISQSLISRVCNGERKSTNGLKFEYYK